jgi:hypothetical protein
VATGATFKDAHCKEAGTGSGFKHVVLPANEPIPAATTNVTTGTERSIAKLKSVQSGVTLELQATEVGSSGLVENKIEGATTWAQGSGSTTFKNVTVTAPAGKGCVVNGGSISTSQLVFSTKGLTNQAKISPESGTRFASFTVSGCSVTALNHEYEVTGSVIGNTVGATTSYTHSVTTEQGTLFLFGQKAGLELSTTLKRASNGNGLALT